jgi:hypothetical protein
VIWLLANAIPPATRDEISMGFSVIAALLAMAALYKQVFVRKPPIEAEFVKLEEFREFQAEVRRELSLSYQKLADKLDENKTEILNAGERRAIAIHERINSMEKQVAAVNERTKHM